ncbi:MAG: WD40/YVTN/BNR-like repeat-containing protein, partial [Longimicrobiales bacterium]
MQSHRSFTPFAALAIIVLAAPPSAAQSPAARDASGTGAMAPSIDPGMLHGLDYRMVGPSRGGRVTAVAGHAAQPRTFYFGGTGGGVWKSTDAGQSWENVSDDAFAVGSIGAIDVADSDPNVIYVGTGSAGLRSNVSIGNGVYRSTDGGESWAHVGLPDAGQIGSIAVHPSNPDVAYVAALGTPFGRNVERGVFRTTDGGQSWEKVLFVSDSTGAVDLAMNPRNPNEIYASLWRAERKPWTIISGALEGGIYKTADGGDSWNQLTNGLPTGLRGKSSVTVSPSNPNIVYVLIEAEGDQGGVYRT